MTTQHSLRSSGFVLGITGGIAAGKTCVTDTLRDLGCTVIDADTESRLLTAAEGNAIPAISTVFGREFIAEDGSMNRAKMRALVFSDPAARQKLENIIHPMVQENIRKKLNSSSGSAPYKVLVTPLLPSLLFLRPALSRILVIDVPQEVQISRLMQKRNLTEETAAAIIRAQSSRKERLAAADDVIFNTGTEAELQKAVSALHSLYAEEAAQLQKKE